MLAPLLYLVLEAQTARGRVVDAFTEEPVSGAAVEIWTEETNPRAGGFLRVDATLSGPDGRFLVALSTDGLQGEKVRVSRPGYLTLSTTVGAIAAGDERVMLFPAERDPPRLRVVDALGRPIEGARVTTTYSCSHDVPAIDVRTDARGVAVLHAFGLQERLPELRLRAEGFAALEYLSGAELLGRTRAEEAVTVHLPRRQPARLRLLDREGVPLAGAAIHAHEDEGEHVLHTDAAGRIRIASRYGNAEVSLLYMLPEGERWIGAVRPLADREVVVRSDPEDWPDDLLRGRLRIDLGGVAEIEAWMYHADGWLWSGRIASGRSLEVPAGAGLVTAGGPFSGWSLTSASFDVAPGAEVALALAPSPEPRVRVLAPPGDGKLWIQAGADTLEEVSTSEPVPVPGDRPLCFFLVAGGSARRAFLGHAEDGAVVDLRDERSLLEPACRRAQTPKTVHVQLVPATGTTLGGGTLRLSNRWSGCELVEERDATGNLIAARLQGPSGAPWLVSLRRADGSEIWLRGRLRTGDTLRRVPGP